MPTARKIKNVINAQAGDYPVYLTNMTLDALNEDVMPEVFHALGLQGSTLGEHGEYIGHEIGEFVRDNFYPLTSAEAEFTEDSGCYGGAHVPYGGVYLSTGLLWKGQKFLAPTVEICFDGPKRPFSVESYGNKPDSIYEDRQAAKREAEKLAKFLRPKIHPYSVYIHPDAEPDRYAVYLMFPADHVVKQFESCKHKYDAFRGFVEGLFLGYTPTPSKLKRPQPV